MPLVSPRGNSPASPILCYVTDSRSLASGTGDTHSDVLVQRMADAISAGVDWIQVREKDLSGKEIVSLTREALARTKRANQRDGPTTQIVVNDRLDIAVSEGAGGVHLGEQSLPVKDVRDLLAAGPGKEFLLGVSCHSMNSAMCAARDGASYIFFGPVFATPLKAAFGAPQGLPLLSEICRSVTIPVLAIGGITLENAPACLAAGAAGIAAIRLFQEVADLLSLVQALRVRL